MKFLGRHNGKFWAADNKAVFLFLRLKCHGTNAWSTIQAFAQGHNGKRAWVALEPHFMGVSVFRGLEAKGHKVLETIYWDGMKKNFSFTQFIALLRDAFDGTNVTNERHTN